MKLHPLVIAIALATGLAGCNQNNTPAAGTETAVLDQAKLAAELDQLYADYWQANLKLSPINATFIGDTRYNAELPNFFTAEYRQQTHDLNQSWLDKALALDGSRLDGPGRISYEIFVRERKLALESEKYPTWMLPIDQFNNIATFFRRRLRQLAQARRGDSGHLRSSHRQHA